MSRLPPNEMSSGVFQLLFMQSFLWNAGIGWTIPNRNSCECLPLIKPLSCTNTLHPAQTESDFEAFFCLHCGADILKGASAFSLLTSRPSAAFAVWWKTQESSLLDGYLYLPNLTPSLTVISNISAEGTVGAHIGRCLQWLRSLWDQICQIGAC